jgi:DnaJ-class molecular chaperone
MPLFRNPSQYDDLIVEINHVLPKKLSEKQRELLKSLKNN